MWPFGRGPLPYLGDLRSPWLLNHLLTDDPKSRLCFVSSRELTPSPLMLDIGMQIIWCLMIECWMKDVSSVSLEQQITFLFASSHIPYGISLNNLHKFWSENINQPTNQPKKTSVSHPIYHCYHPTIPKVGPFTVHPTTVPAHATVRFAVSGLFSAHEVGGGEIGARGDEELPSYTLALDPKTRTHMMNHEGFFPP